MARKTKTGAIQHRVPDTDSATTSAQRLAASRERMQALLRNPEIAEQAKAVMQREEPWSDEIVERARAGEFADAAFIEGYGEEFVKDLKSRYGG